VFRHKTYNSKRRQPVALTDQQSEMGALGHSCAMIEQLAASAKRYSIVRVIKKLWIEA
jgi:hypothetical protein